MITQCAENLRWLSSAYLVVDRSGNHGVIIDAHRALDPLCERAEHERVTETHVLLTHHHYDNVQGIAEVAQRLGAPLSSRATLSPPSAKSTGCSR